MTRMTAEELAESPGTCPCCRQSNVDYGPVEIKGANAIQEATCFSCFAAWYEVYAFQTYILTEEPQL